jgi:hypothetical protein
MLEVYGVVLCLCARDDPLSVVSLRRRPGRMVSYIFLYVVKPSLSSFGRASLLPFDYAVWFESNPVAVLYSVLSFKLN